VRQPKGNAVDELYRVPENGKAEIVGGEMVLVSPTGGVPGRLADKGTDYFAAGTLVVWDVDVLREIVVRVYRSADPDHPTVYRAGDVAEAEPALPGWTMPVADILP